MNVRRPFVALLFVVLAGGCKPVGRLFDRAFDRDLLQRGFRAVSIPVNGDQLGPIRVGDRVDVMATFDLVVGGAKRAMTATMLQNVRVVGVVRPDKGSEKGTLVLLLNPNEMQFAALGVQQSELTIALRAPGDDEIYPLEMASFLKFFR